MSENRRALVLGGGGVTGIAWLTGLLRGLEEGGCDFSEIDRIVGTSAGSAVGGQLESGMDLESLYRAQADPVATSSESRPDIHYLRILFRVLPALLVRKDTLRFRRKIGAMALKTGRGNVERRREAIRARIPNNEWRRGALQAIAIDALSGEPRWFDAESGVELIDAVGASCAVPGVYPTVEIKGRHYYDGGIPSPDNASRAAGCDRVLILSPLGGTRGGGIGDRLKGEIETLEHSGSRVSVIVPDPAAREALGRNALDPARRAPSAEAGHRQGIAEAERIRAFWNG